MIKGVFAVERSSRCGEVDCVEWAFLLAPSLKKCFHVLHELLMFVAQ